MSASIRYTGPVTKVIACPDPLKKMLIVIYVSAQIEIRLRQDLIAEPDHVGINGFVHNDTLAGVTRSLILRFNH